MAANKTGVNGYPNSETKMGVDWSYIQETSVQHLKTGTALESSVKKKAGPASKYLEAQHQQRTAEMGLLA